MSRPPGLPAVAAASLRDLVAVLEAAATAYDDPVHGDPLPILDHGLQTAALLACTSPDDVELQVAGLVHDLGHVLAPGDPAGHHRRAARLVRPALGQRVAALVELHVPAKRWLVATDPAYARRMSAASTASLAAQGGPLAGPELDAFARSPFRPAAVLLRRADDAAKEPGLRVPGLDAWRDSLAALAATGR